MCLWRSRPRRGSWEGAGGPGKQATNTTKTSTSKTSTSTTTAPPEGVVPGGHADHQGREEAAHHGRQEGRENHREGEDAVLPGGGDFEVKCVKMYFLLIGISVMVGTCRYH